MNFRHFAIWGVIAIAAVVVFSVMQSQTHSSTTPDEMTYSELLTRINDGQIQKVVIHGPLLDVHDKSNREYHVAGPTENDPQLETALQAKGVAFSFVPPGQSLLITVLIQMLPLLLLAAVWIFFMRQMQGGARG